MGWASDKKKDGTAIKVTNKTNAINKTFCKAFVTHLNFEFFKHCVYPCGLKKDLILRLEFNMTERVI